MILSQGRTLGCRWRSSSGDKSRYAEDAGVATLEVEGVERAHILRMLEANWMLSGPRAAAAKLGMKRTTLQSLMKRLGIAKPALGAARWRLAISPDVLGSTRRASCGASGEGCVAEASAVVPRCQVPVPTRRHAGAPL